MRVPSNVVGKFTPTGKLRASINLGNPVLAKRDPGSGSPVGVSIDLADNFAKQLGDEEVGNGRNPPDSPVENRATGPRRRE
jgi:polar amino acid transport system substrate-binding protein